MQTHCVFSFILTFLFYPLFSQEARLWYEQPAQRWEETLPLGNGLIGMMPHGGVQDESIILNEISMWSGSPEDANNYEAHKSVKKIQQLLFYTFMCFVVEIGRAHV